MLAKKALIDGDIKSAIAHLYQASEADFHDDYSLTMLELISNNIERTHGELTFRGFEKALGIYAAIAMPNVDIAYDFCRSHAYTLEGSSVCTRVGRVMFNHSRSFLSQGLGAGILKEHAQNGEMLFAEWSVHQDQVAAEYYSLGESVMNRGDEVIPPHILDEYFRLLRTEGELFASEYFYEVLAIAEY